jgi:hypothetical protein
MYTCCKLGFCVSVAKVVQPLQSTDQSSPGPLFLQSSQYALDALYRFQCSMQTVSDVARLEYELELAECEQN